jgi:DNA polymerase III delta prime subunit
LPFRKPKPEQIENLVKEICEKERKAFNKDAIKQIVEQCQSDIRSVLGYVQVNGAIKKPI